MIHISISLHKGHNSALEVFSLCQKGLFTKLNMDDETNLVQDKNHVIVRLVSVSQLGHSCMKKLVTLHVPL